MLDSEWFTLGLTADTGALFTNGVCDSDGAEVRLLCSVMLDLMDVVDAVVAPEDGANRELRFPMLLLLLLLLSLLLIVSLISGFDALGDSALTLARMLFRFRLRLDLGFALVPEGEFGRSPFGSSLVGLSTDLRDNEFRNDTMVVLQEWECSVQWEKRTPSAGATSDPEEFT